MCRLYCDEIKMCIFYLQILYIIDNPSASQIIVYSRLFAYKSISRTLGQNIYDSYNFCPARWLSAGYLAEKVLIANNVNIPYLNEIVYRIQKIARACFYGDRFEMFYKGFAGNGYEYDINSDYPYALATIPHLTQARWIDSKEMIHPDAKLGFFHIVAKVHSSVRVAPFPFRRKNNRIFFPFGQLETDVTLREFGVGPAAQPLR